MSYNTTSTAVSLTKGAAISTFTGLMATAATSALITWGLGTPFPSQLMVGGTWAALTAGVFFGGLRDVDFPHAAVEYFLGSPTGKIFRSGKQWVFPGLGSAKITPGQTEELSVTMPATEPEAKDHITVYIGRTEPTVLQVVVVDPIHYSQVANPKLALESAYMNQARLFVNQMESAINIVSEKALFERYIELEPKPEDIDRSAEADAERRKHEELEARLKTLEYMDEDESGAKVSRRVFVDDAVKAVMNCAGLFRKEALGWGLMVTNMFTPSVELPESISKAAERKQEQRELNEVLELKGEAFRRVAKGIQTDLKVTGSDAADRTERLNGGTVTRSVQEHTFGLSGTLEGAASAMLSNIPGAIKHVGSVVNKAKPRTKQGQKPTQQT